ncbi:phosphatase PAP2 family protein [Ferviditalea candida]|uniref:Phosphatase PAP2 family protein n=1 Tax=Ferviditalea candida TaxID=3108399 RepID=A0ABU5ZHQ4_9BACL|nr:phosphatase PAP2 family protein [Paenibacillaceae bacterium T2]
MYLYQSMSHISIAIAILAVAALTISLKTNPLAAAASFVRQLIVSRKYLLHLAAMLLILLINKFELSVEAWMNSSADFTPDIYRLEGDFIANFQHFSANPALTQVAAFFYVVVFPTLFVVSLGIYTHDKNKQLFYALTYTMLINYIVAMPFYLFFPVNEVWDFHHGVKFMILDVFPAFEQQYRPLSGINNCFPSLHTSISVSMALLALKSNSRFWKIYTMVSAVMIIFSIFYLGIHWLTDAAGGLALAFFAATAGIKLSEGLFFSKKYRFVGTSGSKTVGK